MTVIAAMAEFERDLLVERTQAGLSRASAAGTQPKTGEMGLAEGGPSDPMGEADQYDFRGD